MSLFADLPAKIFSVLLIDPPWKYYGDPNKDQAAAKHYPCLSFDELVTLPVLSLCKPRAVVFCWTTGPKLAESIDLLNRWGLSYRGIGFVWVKSTQDGSIISGQGVRPSIVKPTTELVLCASTHSKGRPLPLADESVGQVVVAPRPSRAGQSVHSAKPHEIRRRIERLYPSESKIELFARDKAEGWTVWGNQAP